MHTPEYTKTIKALLAARQELELNLNSCVFHYRNGRKPYAENIEAAKKAFSEVMATLEPQGTSCTHDETLEDSSPIESGTEQTCKKCGATVIRW